MIWFNIKGLEKKISNNELTDKDGFNYVIGFTILSVIGFSFASKSTNDFINLFKCIIDIFINVWGLRTIYKVNNEIDGKDFFKRYFAISWVIGMRVIVLASIFAITIGLAIGLSAVFNGYNLTDAKGVVHIFLSIFTTMISLISYLFIINSFQNLKTAI